MAAPNIVNVSTITGKTTGAAVGTSTASVLSNASSSNKVFKVNMIQVSNVDGTNDASVTINYNTGAAGGGTNYALAKTVLVPADTSIVIISKDTAFYLEEANSITASATAASDLEVVISYEEIS